MRCPHCRTQMDATPKPLAPVRGEHGDLKLVLEGLPARVCPHGHHAPVDADFMFWLIQELKERAGKLPAAAESGMVFKKRHCACGSEVPAKADHREIVRERVAYEGGLAFEAVFEFAMVRCPGCGKTQLRSAKEAQRDVAHSLAGVTDAARFPHSG
ncbi:MAG TPA: hypothetical protein VG873_10535 [Burkholderiales bacterium]|nr:hypothetical protein [Burkholderiales bacterium]